MTRHNRNGVPRALTIVVVVAGTTLLAACGSSSPKSSSVASANARSGAASGAFGANRAAITACLKKQGITLPTPPAGGLRPGQGRGGFGLFGGGRGAAGPTGARGRFAKIRAALAKCGISLPRRTTGARNSPQFRQAVNNFVACVRRNGYSLPAPNFSGNGPVFSASQVKRNDPRFRAAASKCQSLLQFGRRRGGASVTAQ
jgi:hypothetical protein